MLLYSPGSVKQPNVLVTSEGYHVCMTVRIDVNRMARQLEMKAGKYTEGKSVTTARGKLEGG